MEKVNFAYVFMAGLRKNSKLLFLTGEGQLFRKTNVYKDYTRYKCYFEACNVTVAVKNDGLCEQLSLESNHDHAPPVELVKKMQIMEKVKTECGKNTLGKRKGVREIFDEECMKNNDHAAGVSFAKMKRQLHRIRSDGLPKNPTTPAELKSIFDEASFFTAYGSSKHIDKPFYRGTIVEDGFAYSIFLSPTIEEIILKKPKGRRFLIDGTFRTVPSCGYKQLVVVHFHYIDHVSCPRLFELKLLAAVMLCFYCFTDFSLHLYLDDYKDERSL